MISDTKVPWFMTLFCHQKDLGFTGEDIGIREKVCNSFFPMPTDNGMCLTKNIDTNDILKADYLEGYEDYLELNKQESAPFIERGTKWGEISFVLLTAHDPYIKETYGRSQKFNLRKVKLQLHQSKELAKIFPENNYHQLEIPLELEANNEYFIKVTPLGSVTANGFKALKSNKRDCKMENEVSEPSMFKIYTKNNCKYECHVSLAINQCNCKPWDFFHIDNANECDVFGRTCFYGTMKNLTQFPTEICEECVDECDFVKYQKEIIKVRLVDVPDPDGPEYDEKNIHGNYFNCKLNVGKGPTCNGDKGFIDFFYDVNNTFTDPGYENVYNDLYSHFGGYKFQRARIYRNVIIVHLKFVQPEIDIIDVKYTLMDKLALFGGNFGIFETITGWSLLGIINLMFLMVKIVFFRQN